jgi:shikimate dehydrogenase
MRLKLGLLGSGIQKSRMPRLQMHLAETSGIALSYTLLDEADSADFDAGDKVIQLISEGFQGINVTHPFKQRVHKLVSSALIPGHEKIGSYNTLKFSGSGIYGANTDYLGFIQAYHYRRGNVAPGNVFMAGAGGVGRAVACALADLGCDEMYIYDVLVSQSESLAQYLHNRGVRVKVVNEFDKDSYILASDGLVNCTNIGMSQYPGTAFDPVLIESQAWAFDAIYTPIETPFITNARESGLACISGFLLWLFQGLEAFMIFTGTKIELEQKLLDAVLDWFDPLSDQVAEQLLQQANS